MKKSVLACALLFGVSFLINQVQGAEGSGSSEEGATARSEEASDFPGRAPDPEIEAPKKVYTEKEQKAAATKIQSVVRMKRAQKERGRLSKAEQDRFVLAALGSTFMQDINNSLVTKAVLGLEPEVAISNLETVQAYAQMVVLVWVATADTQVENRNKGLFDKTVDACSGLSKPYLEQIIKTSYNHIKVYGSAGGLRGAWRAVSTKNPVVLLTDFKKYLDIKSGYVGELLDAATSEKGRWGGLDPVAAKALFERVRNSLIVKFGGTPVRAVSGEGHEGERPPSDELSTVKGVLQRASAASKALVGKVAALH
jgi:hypothetical protein